MAEVKILNKMREIPLTFKSEGQQIIGILHLPKIKRAPLIIMVHGWSGHKLGCENAFFVKFARDFQAKDFAVLRFDFRGSGDSEGNFEDQTITSMLKDLDSVILQISKFPEVDGNKICLLGHSQGGYVSTLKAIKDKRIKSLILLAGRISDYENFSSKVFRDEVEQKGFATVWGFKITLKYLKDISKYHLLNLIKNFRIPACLIYGEADDTVFASDGLKLFKKIKGPKELKVLKDSDHCFSGGKIQNETIKIILNWLNKYLKK